MSTLRSHPAIALLFVLGCSGSTHGSSFASTTDDAGPASRDAAAPPTGGDAADSSSAADGESLFHEAGADGPSVCDPPDVLVVLDHTDSMSQTPQGQKPADDDAGYPQTKWVLAVGAVTAMTAAPMDQTVRFGFERFPLDPQTIDAGTDGGDCVTLPDLLSGHGAKNEMCEPGQLLVSPGLGNGSAIASHLSPLETRLCVSTPIGLALETATSVLQGIAVTGRSQYVVLVTDGGETCKGNDVGEVQALAQAGVETYVVGFGTEGDGGAGGVNVRLLNELACAGKTASSFATSCKQTSDGYEPADPSSQAPLFFAAQDGSSLQSALQTITSAVCCACAQ